MLSAYNRAKFSAIKILGRRMNHEPNNIGVSSSNSHNSNGHSSNGQQLSSSTYLQHKSSHSKSNSVSNQPQQTSVELTKPAVLTSSYSVEVFNPIESVPLSPSEPPSTGALMATTAFNDDNNGSFVRTEITDRNAGHSGRDLLHDIIIIQGDSSSNSSNGHDGRRRQKSPTVVTAAADGDSDNDPSHTLMKSNSKSSGSDWQ